MLPSTRALVLALAATLAACAGDPVPLTACTAGVQTACTCTSGSPGAQRCASDGSGFGACMCAEPVDVGADASADADAGPGADAAAGDGGSDVMQDALGLDAAGDAGDGGDALTDVPPDLPCRGQPGLTYCTAPSPGCFDLQTEVIHCGACHNFCYAPRARCRAGVCVE